MLKMTVAQALAVQAKQVAHYSQNYSQCAALVAAATDTTGLDADVEYDMVVINRHVPRGHAIEVLLGFSS